MTYRGHVEKGAIVLDEPAQLPDGALVTIQLASAQPGGSATRAFSLADHYRSFIGAVDDLPEDWSENHDKYLREQCES